MGYPLISLAIPVYNTSKYLEKCLNSAIAQTYPNLEIVVLNNGSTDNSQDIIYKFGGKDKRIKSYTIEHVATVKESKDNCYRRITGEWVITLDSDDAIDSAYVQKMWDAHLCSGADMIISQRISVDEEGTEYDYLPSNTFDFDTIYSGSEALRRTIVKWQMSVNGALVQKSNLYNIMLENPTCKVFSDEYDSRILLKNAIKVGFCKAKYYYTFNPNSVGKKNNWNRHRFRLNTRLGLLDLCKDEYGIASYEYQHAVFQSLGIALVACKYYLCNKASYTEENKDEFKKILIIVIASTQIPNYNIISIRNHVIKVILKILCFLAVRRALKQH